MEFLIGIILLLFGFLIGNNVPKIKNKPKYIKQIPPIIKIKKGHTKPGITYNENTFVRVNKCSDCETVAREYDMFLGRPCQYCGGKVLFSGIAKWTTVDGKKQWVFKK